MQVYEMPKVRSLPETSTWLTMEPIGPGDELVEELFEEQELVIASTALLPSGSRWKKFYERYMYPIPPLQTLKEKLDLMKRPMDDINNDEQKRKKMELVADKLRGAHLLKKRTEGILAQRYGVPVATNAYLKMIELLPLVFEKEDEKKTPSAAAAAAASAPTKPKAKKTPSGFNTFHMAEAPGNFILALNHFLYSHDESLLGRWEWRANTMEEIRPREKVHERGQSEYGYLGDDYGIIAKYRERWMLGADGDGDITSPDNLRSFAQDLPPIDLVTSDVKVVPKGMDFSKEENWNIPVQMAHLLGSLMCLREGGNMIIKEFTKFETMSVCLLMVACYCFKKVRIVKPETSRAANSEIYVVGTGFENRLDAAQTEKLLRVLKFIRFLGPEDYPALFRSEDLNKEKDFLRAVIDTQKELVQKQEAALKYNYKKVGEYLNQSEEALMEQRRAKMLKEAEAWLARNPLKKLDEAHRLIEDRPRGPRPHFHRR